MYKHPRAWAPVCLRLRARRLVVRGYGIPKRTCSGGIIIKDILCDFANFGYISFRSSFPRVPEAYSFKSC